MRDISISKRPRILIADDEEFNRLLLGRILQQEYDIDFACNGQEVLEKLNQRDYSALLLDIMMPVMNGLDTLKVIRQVVNLATLPVIIVSALSDNEAILTGIQLGANDYISKPIDPQIVLARLKTQVTLKQLMDERNSAVAALEAANQLKLRMMQIASHDLRNPLNNLSMLMTLLGNKGVKEEQMPKMLHIANTGIETMLNIIDDFLGGNAFDDGGMLPDIIELSGQNLLDTMLNQYNAAANHKNIEIIIEQFDDAIILADEKRITQVISNLVSNAVKYTPCNGRVYIRGFETLDMWRLEIQDTGAGIPQEERQHLFQAFSKNNISTKPTDGESSTGLGLWIAAEMMRIQHGTIGMDSPQEGGCCFWIEIPCVEQHQEHMLSASA